jgi:hypothetical protein
VARLGAIARGLFYPTPSRVVEMIADAIDVRTVPRHVRLALRDADPVPEKGALLDPCAGTGEPAAYLASRWGLASYGVELQAERAAEAAARMDVCLRGSYHQIEVDNKGAFSVLFLNPPYDDATTDDGVSARQEVLFLRATLEHLVHDGLLVYVVPRRILRNQALVDLFRRHFRRVQVWKFPEPEVEAFDQVVVVARMYRPEYAGYGYYGEVSALADDDFPVLGSVPYRDINETEIDVPVQTVGSFSLHGTAPEEICPSHDIDDPSGAYASQHWLALTGDRDDAADAPLMAPRPGHQAMLLAAGQLNGLELDGCLVKGGSEKVVSTIEHENETVERERIVSHLSVLSLQTGVLDTWRVDEDPQKTSDWFRRHGDDLARGILSSHAPSFDGDVSDLDFSRLRAPGLLPGRREPELLEVQQQAAGAVLHRWRRFKSAIVSGEMGCGKTVLAITACELAGHERVVVVCPSHLVPKWIRECEAVTGHPGVAVTAKKVSEVDAFFHDDPEPDEGILGMLRAVPTRPRYLVLSKEMAKLGSRWTPAFNVRHRTIVREVNLRDVDHPYSTYRTKIVREHEPVVSCSSCGAMQTPENIALSPRSMDGKTKRQCTECEAPLWSNVPLNDKGTKRWPLARFVNRRHANRYALVIDECFPGNTLIETRTGLVPIRNIAVGDEVLSRSSSGNLVYRRVVRHIPRKRGQRLLTLHHEAGEVTCTPDHKIWTENRGYVRARDLTSADTLVVFGRASKAVSSLRQDVHLRSSLATGTGDVQPSVRLATQADLVSSGLRGLWQDVATENEGRTFLQYELCSSVENGSRPRMVEKGARRISGTASRSISVGSAVQREARDESGKLGANAPVQPNSRDGGDPREDSADTSRQAVHRIAWRQRLHHAGATAAAREDRLADGSVDPYEESQVAEGDRRSRPRGTHDRGGVRRGFPSHSAAEEQGPQEGPDAHRHGVEGAAVLELGDHRQDGGGNRENSRSRVLAVRESPRRDEWVYDLEVEDTHCYFADGVLVSNCHQYKGSDSDQSRAVQWLASGATKILAMTGTLYGGRASSIFHLLYKVENSFRRMYRHDQCSRFVEHHGLFETVYKEEESTSVYGYRRGRTGGRVREIPGMSPAMIPILLPYTVFVKLRDLRIELPPYHEEVMLVDHDHDVEWEARSMANEVRTVVRKYPSILGQYLMACLGYPDRPDQEERIVVPESAERNPGMLVAEARAFEHQLWPKDEKVVEIAVAEKKAGRKVLVFFTQTHRRDARGRVKAALEGAGLRVVVLDSNVPPEKREQWLRDAEDEGFDVMLTNGRLVETGMDLLFANTIVQYGIEYSVATIRQSVRRSWRLGQTKPVRVVFLGYRRTMQETALNLIARKMRASEAIDGDEAGGLAHHDDGGANFLVELAQEVLEGRPPPRDALYRRT